MFFHCKSLNMCSNLYGNNDFLLKPCRWLIILIAIGQELMGTLHHVWKINQMHILLPGWWSGVATIANKPNTSQRSNLWHSLPSKNKSKNLMSIRACTWKNAHERKIHKQWQCLHQVLNTILTTILLYFFITIKI
jgi:hypothetical protein